MHPDPSTPVPAAAALRVLLVDDESLARQRLRQLLADCAEPATTVVGEAANATQALVWLAEHRCDLLLLDIGMPGRSGTALAAELQRLRVAGEGRPVLVFVTAHAEHALAAFDLDAADYLTKPVRRDRLQAALQRVVQRLGPPGAGPAAPAEAAPRMDALRVSDRGRLVRVPVDEVLYLKAELKYVTLRTAEHSHVLDQSLNELELGLGKEFLRVHRNALVARRALRALERRAVPGQDDESGESWAVRVAPVDEWLAVSRRQLSAVREALGSGRR